MPEKALLQASSAEIIFEVIREFKIPSSLVTRASFFDVLWKSARYVCTPSKFTLSNIACAELLGEQFVNLQTRLPTYLFCGLFFTSSIVTYWIGLAFTAANDNVIVWKLQGKVFPRDPFCPFCPFCVKEENIICAQLNCLHASIMSTQPRHSPVYLFVVDFHLV